MVECTRRETKRGFFFTNMLQMRCNSIHTQRSEIPPNLKVSPASAGGSVPAVALGSSIKQQANWKQHRAKALWLKSLIQNLPHSVGKLSFMQKPLQICPFILNRYNFPILSKGAFVVCFESFFTLYSKQIKSICCCT